MTHLAADIPNALAQLWQRAIPMRIGTGEQRDECNARPALGELARQLEGDRTARAVARDDHGTAIAVKGADLVGEIRGEILDARQWLGLPVDTRRLEPKERL